MMHPEFFPGLVSSVATTPVDTARIALIYKPTNDGSNEAKAAAIQERLRSEGSIVMSHPSERDIVGNQQVLQHLVAELNPTLIGGLGGDGTESNILSALQNMQRSGQQIPVWLLNGGRINDLHHELYGSYNYHHPEHALHAGHFVKAYPISFSFQHPDGSESSREAWGYGSFGDSAEVAVVADSQEHRLDRSKHRTAIGQFAVDAKMALDTISTGKPFTIVENGVEQQYYDLVLTKGSQMAGMLRFRNINLLRPEFGRTELITAGKLALAKTVIKARFRGVQRLTDETLRFTLQDTADGQPIHFQRDGEAELIEVGTLVTAGLSSQGLYLHTTRRR